MRCVAFRNNRRGNRANCRRADGKGVVHRLPAQVPIGNMPKRKQELGRLSLESSLAIGSLTTISPENVVAAHFNVCKYAIRLWTSSSVYLLKRSAWASTGASNL